MLIQTTRPSTPPVIPESCANPGPAKNGRMISAVAMPAGVQLFSVALIVG